MLLTYYICQMRLLHVLPTPHLVSALFCHKDLARCQARHTSGIVETMLPDRRKKATATHCLNTCFKRPCARHRYQGQTGAQQYLHYTTRYCKLLPASPASQHTSTLIVTTILTC